MYSLCFTVHELLYITFTLCTMEKGSPSTPPADSTQGSCPVQDRASQPSSTQVPALFISDNVSKSTKSSTSTDLQKLSSSFQHSSHTSPQQPDSSSDGSPFPFTHPIFETDFTEDSAPASDQNPLASSHECSPNQIPSFPKQSATNLSRNSPADSSCASPKSTPASATTSISPMKRSFASMAKLVILQEKLQKAQERDANDEEDGEISFYLARSVPVEFACFPVWLLSGYPAQSKYMHLDYSIQHIKSKEDYIKFCFTE